MYIRSLDKISNSPTKPLYTKQRVGYIKEMAYKGGYIVGFFNPPEENLSAEKRYTVEWDYYSL